MNTFLYSLYKDRYQEAQNVEELGEKSIETRLKDDKITHPVFSNSPNKIPYISAEILNFKEANLTLTNQDFYFYNNDTRLHSTLIKPVKLRNIKDNDSFREFVSESVYKGSDYALWEINRDERKATFFQRVKDRTIYYNEHGLLEVYWNDRNEVTRYEQTMLKNIESLEQSDNVMPESQVVRALYDKGLLRPETTIVHMKLGYSTLVPLTETQVFVPTWEVRLHLPDDTIETHFVNNSVEGKVVDLTTPREEEKETELEDKD